MNIVANDGAQQEYPPSQLQKGHPASGISSVKFDNELKKKIKDAF